MEKLIVILTVLLLFFIGCTTIKKLTGNYHDGKYIEIEFTEAPNKFEYYFRSEMGVLEYSAGSWVWNKNQVVLNGFDDSNIRILKVENEITDNADESQDKIHVQYTTANNLIKADVVINDNTIIRVSNDTTFFFTTKIETIQVKSYLSSTGLLSSSPKIDTLYSSKINVGNGNDESKNIILNFSVHPYDFVRVQLTDTLTVKNRHTLYNNKTKLKKSIQ